MPYHKFIELINILKYPFDDLTTINDAFPLAYYLLVCVILSLRPQQFRQVGINASGRRRIKKSASNLLTVGIVISEHFFHVISKTIQVKTKAYKPSHGR